jgi:hypothetical protein
MLNVGDKVQWTHVVKRSQSVSLQKRVGTITEIDGNRVMVLQAGRKRPNSVPLKRLRRIEEKSQVMELVEAMGVRLPEEE